MRDILIGVMAVQAMAGAEAPPVELAVPVAATAEWSCADARSVAEVGLAADRAALRAFVVARWQAGAEAHGPGLARLVRQTAARELVRQSVAACDSVPDRTRFGRVVAAMIDATARKARHGTG